MADEAMQIDTPPTIEEPTTVDETQNEEDVSDLQNMLDSALENLEIITQSQPYDTSAIQKEVINKLDGLLNACVDRMSSASISIQELAILALAKARCFLQDFTGISELLTTSHFFTDPAVSKAKCAKIIRSVLDLVIELAPENYEVHENLCRQILKWAKNRAFLRQRVEAKLASVLYSEGKYSDALEILDQLLTELKQLDDKPLLVETHLVESKVQFALRNHQKSKAALTASRTAANSIYVTPTVQASIDEMSGILHCEEGDYDTAHSYFLEAFEQLDSMSIKDDVMDEKCLPCLKYMMLCRILDSLGKVLKISAMGAVGVKTDTKKDVDMGAIISPKQALKYAGRDVDAMKAIGDAASKRSLKEFEAVRKSYEQELVSDLLVKHHLKILQEQLLESNLIRIIEPYSCVEISHVAELIEMPLAAVEKKLSQMILDGKFQGILDQGKGQLIVYEDSPADLAMDKGLGVISNMDKVVTSLFHKSQALRAV